MSATTDARVRVCRNCYDYADGHALVKDGPDGWVHDYPDGGERCPGQEDDDTDDRAEPMWLDRDDAIHFGIVDA